MKFRVTGHRDLRVRYEIVVDAPCEGDVTDERVGVAIAEATRSSTTEDLDGAEVVDEQIDDVTRED